MVDGAVGPKLGTVGVTATNGTVTTSSFSSTYAKTGYTAVAITSLGSGNIGTGFSPALAVANQIAYDSSKGAVGADGIFTGTYTGTQTLWDHNKDDFKWRSVSLTTVNGSYLVVASPSGVSSSASVGSATAAGASKATPAGVSVASAVGTPIARGAAAAAPSGVAASGAVGTAVATVQAAGSVIATPLGVSAAASIGSATAVVVGPAAFVISKARTLIIKP
jgi:hypothetical protein